MSLKAPDEQRRPLALQVFPLVQCRHSCDQNNSNPSDVYAFPRIVAIQGQACERIAVGQIVQHPQIINLEAESPASEGLIHARVIHIEAHRIFYSLICEASVPGKGQERRG